MSIILAVRNIVILLVFVAEPIIFTLDLPVSVPLLLLKQTWPAQVAVGCCLALIGLTKRQALKAIIVMVVLINETYLFMLNDRAFGIFILCFMFTFPIQVFIGFNWVLISSSTHISVWSMTKRTVVIGLVLLYSVGIGVFMMRTPSSLWGAEEIRNTVQVGEDHYYLITKMGLSGPGCDFYCGFRVPTFYKCDSIGLHCTLIFDDDLVSVSEADLVVDKGANEIQVFLSYYIGNYADAYHGHELFYVYGKQPRFIIDSKKFGGNLYYLSRLQGHTKAYTLYGCNQAFEDCKRLPFEYLDVDPADVEMEIDESGKLSIIASYYSVHNSHEELVYTYDIDHLQPACQITSCTQKDQ